MEIENKKTLAEEQRMLFFDSISGLYFYSTPEKIKETNEILTNLINDCDEVNVSQYLSFLGLDYYQNFETANYRNDIGWKINENLSKEFFDIVHDVRDDGTLVDVIVPISPVKYIGERIILK